MTILAILLLIICLITLVFIGLTWKKNKGKAKTALNSTSHGLLFFFLIYNLFKLFGRNPEALKPETALLLLGTYFSSVFIGVWLTSIEKEKKIKRT